MISSEHPGKGLLKGPLLARVAGNHIGPVLHFSESESGKMGFSDLHSLLPTNDNVLSETMDFNKNISNFKVPIISQSMLSQECFFLTRTALQSSGQTHPETMGPFYICRSTVELSVAASEDSDSC